jgi:c-di-GMP phosphodiesterase
MENVYLGRQPIFDDKGQLFAYEILYRDKDKQSKMINDRFTSASVISSILNKFGTRSLLGDRMAFVKIDEKFLMNDIIFLAPKEFFIFSLIESIEINEKILERVHQLFTKGYKLCINDTVLTQETFMKYSPILKELSFFKVTQLSHIKPNSFCV